ALGIQADDVLLVRLLGPTTQSAQVPSSSQPQTTHSSVNVPNNERLTELIRSIK
ncbi:hypothetical protein NECAME_05307, partial [Necator americanus]